MSQHLELTEVSPLCLTVLNSEVWRGTARHIDRLEQPEQWLALVGDWLGWPDDVRASLWASRHSEAAQQALAAARQARAGVRAVLESVLDEGRPWHGPATFPTLVWTAQGLQAAPPPSDWFDLGPYLWLSLAGLLSGEHAKRLKRCADQRGCGWYFLDHSRNLSRQYCSSAACANYARQQRFRQKKEAT
ncbi:CGNR zinc finger domain-containing protein [Leeia aquatica]|uniref:CGNR zinc finger domain-containing protein n=1 Tax=Leeia aquatica TaxID=2725557 RepID=A0A847S9U1_9NEIS|nr:CGNR zinc finger domain-containing protein [Leeia aquatica]NLR75635.1 CGNR zinc finger domain-containing protein [Leeia aquatica]